MRFKQFISESRGRDITLKEAAEWIKKNSKTMMEELTLDGVQYLLYRGKKNAPNPQMGNASESVRMSANTSNEYTLLIDSSPTWKNFPKRSKSFICTTSLQYAETYGQVQMVFPKDSAMIGCAGAKDFWIAFASPRMLDIFSLKDLNDYINRMLDLTGQDSHQTDAKVLRERLRKITDEAISAEADPDNHYAKLTLTAMKRLKVNNMEALLDKMLDPAENGQDAFHLSEWENFYSINSEYWFSDDAVFVPVSMKKKLLEILK